MEDGETPALPAPEILSSTWRMQLREGTRMRRLRQAHVHRTILATVIGCSTLACQHVGSGSASAPELFIADEIDVNNGTIGSRKISALTEVEVRLRGLV